MLGVRSWFSAKTVRFRTLAMKYGFGGGRGLDSFELSWCGRTPQTVHKPRPRESSCLYRREFSIDPCFRDRNTVACRGNVHSAPNRPIHAAMPGYPTEIPRLERCFHWDEARLEHSPKLHNSSILIPLQLFEPKRSTFFKFRSLWPPQWSGRSSVFFLTARDLKKKHIPVPSKNKK